MADTLPIEIKAELQSRFRQYESLYRDGSKANEALKRAKASRVWVVGVLAGLFSFHSDFFLGAAFAVFAVYGYQIVAAQISRAQMEDAMEDLGRWFASRGIALRDTTPFFRNDDQLENPLNLMDDGLYS